MKKLFLFISTLVLPLSFVTKKVYAQTEHNLDYDYPNVVMKLEYESLYGTIENDLTFEFVVGFKFDLSIPVPDELNVDEYFLVTKYHIPFTKGLDRNINSYEFYQVSRFPGVGSGAVDMRITLSKEFISQEDGSINYNLLYEFFDNTVLYIKYIARSGSTDYSIGYSDGYDVGFSRGSSEGYSRGYYDGYDIGFEKGKKEPSITFLNNLHVWVVPAIIIVLVAGIFVGYRRERYGGE